MRRTFACVGVLLMGVAAAAQNPAVPAPPSGVPNKAAVLPMQGKVVRVDPQKGTVVIRTGVAGATQDREYRVGKGTRYFGANRAAIKEGLRHTGFKEGAPVWYRLLPPKSATPGTPGAGADPRRISQIGFGPAGPTPARPPQR